MQEISSKIISTGSYLPKKIVTNNDLAKTIDTSDEWITERTGIKQRHIAAEDELTSDLGYKAAINAIEGSNIEKNDIDIIIVATTTADNIFPSVATKIQEKLSITNCFAFDVQAACSGFVYGLVLADSLIKTQQYKNILLIGCETLSRIVNWQDRTTSVLFGDGAGAVIISKNQEDDSGIISHSLSSDGSLYEILKTSGGPSLTGGEGHIIMQGQEVFKNAVNKMYQSVNDLLKKSNFLIDDILKFISNCK